MLSTTFNSLKSLSKASLNGTFIFKNNNPGQLLFTYIVFNYTHLKKSDRQSSQSILKQYFSSRLSLSPAQLERYLVDLSKNGDVKIRDHRWQSLYMTIQKYQQDFSLSSKIEIIQALGRMKQNNQLFLTLYKNIVAQFHKLSVEQMAVLVWSMVKAQQNDKTTLLAIYKKLYKIIQDDEKIKLYKQKQQLPFSDPSQNQDDLPQRIHHMQESSFVHLIWALQKTKTIDSKLILDLLKHTLQDKEQNNLQKIRIQNLSLLAYCMEELEFQKYRISQTVINQIMQSWEELQKLSTLSLVLLSESFTSFVHYQQKYLEKYKANFTPQDIAKKQQYLAKQKRFIFLIVQTIFLKQTKPHKIQKSQKAEEQIENNQGRLERLNVPLSSKFASQVLFGLGKLKLYDRKIWYKLLTSITDDVDKAQVQDLSMSLTAICNLNTKEIPPEDVKSVIYAQKEIICKRVFQIYTSLSGKSLQNIKQLVFERKLENQFVPSRVRREVEKQFMNVKIMAEQNQQKQSENSQKVNKKVNNTIEREMKPRRKEKHQNLS